METQLLEIKNTVLASAKRIKRIAIGVFIITFAFIFISMYYQNYAVSFLAFILTAMVGRMLYKHDEIVVDMLKEKYEVFLNQKMNELEEFKQQVLSNIDDVQEKISNKDSSIPYEYQLSKELGIPPLLASILLKGRKTMIMERSELYKEELQSLEQRLEKYEKEEFNDVQMQIMVVSTLIEVIHLKLKHNELEIQLYS